MHHHHHKNILETVRKYTIGDGLNIVACPLRSHGSFIHDSLTRKEFLDCYSSFSSQPVGWNHPYLVAMTGRLGTAAINKYANSDMYCADYSEFISSFTKIASDFKHFFFIDGGSMAVENALKAAFDYKMKKLGWHDDSLANNLDVIHLEHAFHGRSGYALSLTNTKPIKTWGFPKFNWTRLVNPCFGNEEISLIQAEEAMERNNVAALIIEPIQGEGGDVHFSSRYLLNLRGMCQRYDVLFIVDEVQTGLTTGKTWAYEHFNLQPDMICFGKKTQTCGFAATSKIDEVKDNVFSQSGRINSTWGGNIVDMVRFTLISEIMEKENLIENSAVVGSYFLDKLKNCNAPIENVRGRGFMIAFDIIGNRDNAALKLHDEGLLALKCGENAIRFRPPLTFSKTEVDLAVSFIEKALT